MHSGACSSHWSMFLLSSPCKGLWGLARAYRAKIGKGRDRPMGAHGTPWGAHGGPMGPHGTPWGPMGDPWDPMGPHGSPMGPPWGAAAPRRHQISRCSPIGKNFFLKKYLFFCKIQNLDLVKYGLFRGPEWFHQTRNEKLVWTKGFSA